MNDFYLTQDELDAGNIALAKFTGNVHEDGLYLNNKHNFPTLQSVTVNQLEYHASWDWLMMVIDRIEAIDEHIYPPRGNNFHFRILKRHCELIYDYDTYTAALHSDGNYDIKQFNESSKSYRYCIFNESKIYACWQACVDFCAWWEENKYKRYKNTINGK